MKQAVVLIHGIGEQKPMATLRRFVSSILPPAKEGRVQYWSKPDPMSETFELRRLQVPGRTKTHFYEYYWAYLVDGTKIWHLLQWFKDLLLRKPRDVPPSLRGIWWLCWCLTASIVVLAALGTLTQFAGRFDAQPKYGLAWLAGTLILAVAQAFLIGYVGDAARYLSSHPQNIALRQKIRADGVRLLKQLHESREYDRIIIVGHSLGSVIGYDIITRLWIDYNETYDFIANETALDKILAAGLPPQPNIRHAIHDAGSQLSSDTTSTERNKFREAQQNGWKEQREWGCPWRITDFITLGSPLAHAQLLLASDSEEFATRKQQRELPTCPPVEDEKGYAYPSAKAYTLKSGRVFTPLVLHHAAPFAVTRWTNLYFPVWWGFCGDVIGGSLQAAFGPGIVDIPVALKSWRRFTPLAHTAYWRVEPEALDAVKNPALVELRNALDLSFKHTLPFVAKSK